MKFVTFKTCVFLPAVRINLQVKKRTQFLFKTLSINIILQFALIIYNELHKMNSPIKIQSIPQTEVSSRYAPLTNYV